MKLPIRRKYWEMIKNGSKNIEYRDAHITFICEETGRRLRKNIKNVSLISRKSLAIDDPGLFEDERILAMELEE